MTGKKIIHNVNILDVRKATAPAVEAIERIDNANLVLYSPQTAGLLAALSFNNLNSAIEVPDEAHVEVVFGPLVLHPGYFASLSEPAFPLAVGPLTVAPGVTVEQIEQGLKRVILVGPLICPQALSGAIQNKIALHLGPVQNYPQLGRIHQGPLTLDADLLAQWPDQSEVTVVGSLSAPEVLPADLLAQKVQKLFVLDDVECRGENAAFFRAHLAEGSGRIRAVPAGYERVERPLVLDALLLSALKQRKLYCQERVQIAAEVTPALLDERLEAIQCEELLLASQALQPVLAQKCDLLKTHALFYEGPLWLVEDEQELTAAYLEALDGPVTLVVTGELAIAHEVEPQALAAALIAVNNLGEICCTSAQMAVLRAKMRLQEGELQDSSLPVAPPTETGETVLSNVNYLVL